MALWKCLATKLFSLFQKKAFIEDYIFLAEILGCSLFLAIYTKQWKLLHYRGTLQPATMLYSNYKAICINADYPSDRLERSDGCWISVDIGSKKLCFIEKQYKKLIIYWVIAWKFKEIVFKGCFVAFKDICWILALYYSWF